MPAITIATNVALASTDARRPGSFRTPSLSRTSDAYHRFMSQTVRLRRGTGFRRLLQYSMVSIVAVAVGQIALVALYYFGHWSARSANIGSCIAGGIPSYYLNRRWVWGKSGRSHIRREIVPFWVLTFAGLVLSTWLAGLAGDYGARHVDSRAVRTALVAGASLVSFGGLWVLKFVAFNRYMFSDGSTSSG